MPIGNRLRTNLPRRIHVILLLHRGQNLHDRNPQLRQLIGLHPCAHRILPSTKNRDAGDPRNPRHFIIEVDISVVRQKDPVVSPFRRKKRKHDQRRTRRLLHGHPRSIHLRRKLRRRLRLPHLGENLIGVRIRLDVKIHRQSHRTIIRVDRIHVVHVVHSTHLLLNRRRY